MEDARNYDKREGLLIISIAVVVMTASYVLSSQPDCALGEWRVNRACVYRNRDFIETAMVFGWQFKYLLYSSASAVLYGILRYASIAPRLFGDSEKDAINAMLSRRDRAVEDQQERLSRLLVLSGQIYSEFYREFYGNGFFSSEKTYIGFTNARVFLFDAEKPSDIGEYQRLSIQVSSVHGFRKLIAAQNQSDTTGEDFDLEDAMMHVSMNAASKAISMGLR